MSKSDMDQLTAAQPGLRGMFEQDLNADSVIANGVNSWKINRSKYEAFLQSRAQGTAAGGSAQKAPQAPGQTQPKTKEQVSAFGTRGDQEFSDVSPAGADSAQAFKPVDDDEEEPTDWSE